MESKGLNGCAVRIEVKREKGYDNTIIFSVEGKASGANSFCHNIDWPGSIFLSIPPKFKKTNAKVKAKTLGKPDCVEIELKENNGSLKTKGYSIVWEKVELFRILCINDVYELDHLARFKTAAEQLRTEFSTTLLAGDFVSPSLLSSLDKGKAMIDVLNRAGLEYVCFGNHETDISHKQLVSRVKESKFTWINSNMQDWPGGVKTPEYVTLASQSKKIVLLGLNTDEKALYNYNAFNGAKILPINDTAKNLYEKISKKEKVDAIIPMTHQRMKDDRKLAKMDIGFPLIVGGHDHDVYHETVNGVKIMKTGADAVNFGLCDVYWTLDSKNVPTVETRLLSHKMFKANKGLMVRIEEHRRLIRDLENASLCTVPKEGIVLSSQKPRLRQTSVGTLLASALRDAMQADACLLPAGQVRGNCDYDAKIKYFTYAHLKKELPFRDMRFAVVKLPGTVINDYVSYSRAGIFKTPKVESALFVQMDDHMEWDAKTNRVTHVAFEPIKEKKMYDVVVSWGVLQGMDNAKPLVDYVNKVDCVPDEEMALQARETLVGYFAKCAWLYIVQKCNWQQLDLNKDGFVTKDEVMIVAKKIYGEKVGSLLVDNLMASADLNNDQKISKDEILVLGMLGVVGFLSDANGLPLLDLEKYRRFMLKFFGKKSRGVRQKIDGVFHSIAGSKGIKAVDTFEKLKDLMRDIGRNITI